MKKIIITLIVILVLLAILVTFVISRKKIENTPGSISPTSMIEQPTIALTTSPRSTVTPTIDPAVAAHFEEHHNEQFADNEPLEKAEMIPLDGPIPSNWVLQTAYTFTPDEQGRKFSNNRDFFAGVSGGKLIILNAADQAIIAEVAFDDTIQEVNFAWLANNNMIIIEKDNSDITIDRIYLFNIQTKEKTFILGSFPVISRFNLKIEPKVYDNGSRIIFTANDTSEWYIELTFKK